MRGLNEVIKFKRAIEINLNGLHCSLIHSKPHKQMESIASTRDSWLNRCFCGRSAELLQLAFQLVDPTTLVVGSQFHTGHFIPFIKPFFEGCNKKFKIFFLLRTYTVGSHSLVIMPCISCYIFLWFLLFLFLGFLILWFLPCLLLRWRWF
jgi:hypothetical protein